MSDDRKELATQFIGYADGITAFATAQTVGYTLLLAQGDCFTLNVFCGIKAAVSVGAVVTFLYAALVWMCHREAGKLYPPHQSTARSIKWVRCVRYFLLIVDIAVTGGLPVLLRYGHLHNQFVVDCPKSV